MPFSTNSARFLQQGPRPQLSPAHAQSRTVKFLTLAQELNSDMQLQQALRIAGTAMLGVATDGVPLIIRLASPDVTHVLISGAKASGKTQLLRTVLGSLALYQKPRELQFLVLAENASAYEFLTASPCMLGEIATTPEHALQHLRWLETELERRENELVTRPRLVVAIDEGSEFLTNGGREFQVHLTRLAQRGRGVGISLLVCTNKAQASDLPAELRANFPVRLIGKHSSANDGADKLAGRGDFILAAGGERVRFQAAYLAPQDATWFHAQLCEWRVRPQPRESGLHSFVRRLQRVK